MKHFHYSCIGESHKSTQKPCQDYSFSLVEDDLCIAVVCDGHGDEKYFRSDVGARFCTEITVQKIKDFIACVDESLFKKKAYTREKAIADSDDKLNSTDRALRQLFASIISTWNIAIEKYTDQHPVTDEERLKVEDIYIQAFEKKESLEKTYGCTLMAYVQTKTFWFAFHLGDGKCVSFNHDHKLWQEPIPWDDRCFLNKTTSICDSDALNEFRYCYCGDGDFPVAVFLGSDGMDDSFGPMENLVDFYIQVSKLIASNSENEVQKSIAETLPELSKRGSQDDMSIAYIYDEERIHKLVGQFLDYQIQLLETSVNTLDVQLEALALRISELEGATERKDIIERDYALKDQEKKTRALDKLKDKLNLRKQELVALGAEESNREAKKVSISNPKR